VSRGLGPKQVRLLAMLAERRKGIYTGDLPALLNMQPRKARALVSSLADRGLVATAKDAGESRRVWLPDRRRWWLADREWVRRDTCPTCRQPVIRASDGRIFPPRPVERVWVIGQGWE
jgi:hypothetical protein